MWYIVCALVTFAAAWLVATFVMIKWRYAAALRETVKDVSVDGIINVGVLERDNTYRRFRGAYFPNFWGAIPVLVVLTLCLSGRFVTLDGAFAAGFIGVILSAFLTVRRETRSGRFGIIWANGDYTPKSGEKWNRIDGKFLIRSGITKVKDGDVIATFSVNRFGRRVYAVTIGNVSGSNVVDD